MKVPVCVSCNAKGTIYDVKSTFVKEKVIFNIKERTIGRAEVWVFRKFQCAKCGQIYSQDTINKLTIVEELDLECS